MAGCDDDGAEEATVAEPSAESDPLDDLGPLADGLPEEIMGFADWLRLNSEPIPPKAADPHLGEKEVFTNATPAQAEAVDSREARYPDSTVIVKSALRPDGDFIGLIAVMRKVRGLDPEHNDWEFVQYTRDSADGTFEVIARDAVCWTCHEAARDTDYVYTRRD
jgi:hypothetical protein